MANYIRRLIAAWESVENGDRATTIAVTHSIASDGPAEIIVDYNDQRVSFSGDQYQECAQKFADFVLMICDLPEEEVDEYKKSKVGLRCSVPTGNGLVNIIIVRERRSHEPTSITARFGDQRIQFDTEAHAKKVAESILAICDIEYKLSEA